MNDIFESYSEAIKTLLLERFPQEKTEQFSNRRHDKYKYSFKGKEETSITKFPNLFSEAI